VHHEPPDETCGELELDVGADLGDLRPLVFDLAAAECGEVAFDPAAVLAAWLDRALLTAVGALVAEAVIPGRA
jgi:hypothetical protein